MEVHTHTHTPRKKWTHYLWEFLMLFLAVFCGFLAENIRENSVERHRERDYIKLLIEDLHADTAIIHHAIPILQQYVRGLDTLIAETYANLEEKSDRRLMYYAYHHYCRTSFGVVISQRAMNQLKNSGNMRLIRNKQALEIILGIEVSFQQFDAQTNFLNPLQKDPSGFGMKIFDFKEYQKAKGDPGGDVNIGEEGFRKINYQPVLNNTDPGILKEFAARVGYYRNSLSSYIFYLAGANQGFEKDINNLNKIYQF